MNAFDGKAFLRELGLMADIDQLPESAARFENEMLAGLRGEASLRMLPTYISPEDAGNAARGNAADRGVIAVDAGGTNLRVALVSPRGGRAVSYEKHPMPGVERAIGAEEFFDKLAAFLEPVIHESDRIGFCFSYPAEILPNRDARILAFTK